MKLTTILFCWSVHVVPVWNVVVGNVTRRFSLLFTLVPQVNSVYPLLVLMYNKAVVHDLYSKSIWNPCLIILSVLGFKFVFIFISALTGVIFSVINPSTGEIIL